MIRRLIIVYHGLRSRGAGVKRHILQVCRDLERRGIEPQVLALEDLPAAGRYLPHLLQRIGNAVRAPDGDYARYRLTRLLLAAQLRHRLGGRQGTGVVFEDIYTSIPVDVPSVTVAHALQSDNVFQHSLAPEALRRARSWDRAVIMRLRAPAVTVSHEYRRHVAREFGVEAAARLGVIPLGIDLREFPERPHPRPAGVFALVYLGRLEARKNVGFLFALLPKILSAGCTRIRLTIVGEGPLRSRLEAEARARGVGHVVHFAGPIPPTAVPAALQRYHVLLHPSLRESFGYTLLEAKASGVQTVATAGLEVPGDFIDHPLPLDSTLWAQAVTGAYRSWEGNGFLLPSPESLAGLRRRYSAERMVGDYLAVLRGEPVPGDSPDQPGAGSFEGPPRRPASATVPLMRS